MTLTAGVVYWQHDTDSWRAVLAARYWQLTSRTGSTILTADEPYWRHDTNSGRPKNSDRYLPPCHFVLRHKSLKMPVQSVQNVSICGITFTVICEMALWWLLWPKLVAVDITYILLCYTEYVYIYIYCYLTYVNLLISLLNNLPFRSSSPCLFTVQLCAVQLWAVQRVLCSVCCTTVCCTIVCCAVCAVQLCAVQLCAVQCVLYNCVLYNCVLYNCVLYNCVLNNCVLCSVCCTTVCCTIVCCTVCAVQLCAVQLCAVQLCAVQCVLYRLTSCLNQFRSNGGEK